MRTCVAIRHVAFEDAGSLAPILDAAGYRLVYIDAWRGDLSAAKDADLLIVLGGPIGAYEENQYQFLIPEVALLEARLAGDRPTLGICLGAQLIAKALGAPVYPGPAKEIGWSPLSLTDAGRQGMLAALDDIAVLHWHGDTFDLPPRCELLASTPICRQQAFSRGSKVLGLQFHVEVTAAGLEAWLVGHACELSSAGLSPATLRQGAATHADKLETAARDLFAAWLG